MKKGTYKLNSGSGKTERQGASPSFSHAGAEKMRSLAWAAGVTAFLFVLLSLRWDFYFDLNDDVCMKNILSGIYTGTPSSRNIQMLYPISLVISVLYRVFTGFDVYGAALLLLQAFSFALILFRTLEVLRERGIVLWMQVLTAMSVLIPFGVLVLWHSVYVQYSVTCAFLCSAAAFLFITMKLPEEDSYGYTRHFIGACMPSLILLAVSFALRSEMTLLMLPLVLSAALFRYIQVTAGARSGLKERAGRIFCREGLLSILAVLLLLAAVFACEAAADAAACSSPEWREFRAMFDARTELYDYDGAPPVADFDENIEYYEAGGITKSVTELFNTYNYGLDSTIDSGTVKAAAAVTSKVSTQRLSLRDAGWNFRNSLVSPDYAPYNILVCAAYLLILLTALSECIHRSYKQKNLLIVYGARSELVRTIVSLVFLFFVRSALWMYIFVVGRYPERITHSLFLVEFTVLSGILIIRGVRYTSADGKSVEWSIDVFAAQLILISAAILLLPSQVKKADTEKASREYVNAPYEELLSYCAEHPDNFYFVDTYSTVRFSEKMFADYPHAGDASLGIPDNHDTCGGWATDSPLYTQKLAAYGFDSMESALTDSGKAYVIIAQDRSMDWLTDWYSENRGEEVTLTRTDTVGESFYVYKVTAER